MKTIVKRPVGVLLVFVLSLVYSANAEDPVSNASGPPTDLARREKDIRAAYDSVRAAVVKIEIPNAQPGNGVIVTAEGHILTTASVAQKYRDSQIEIQLTDGRRMNAEIAGWN